MKKLLPLAVFVAVALVCQIASVVVALGLEQFGFKWASVLAFGALYLFMFVVAWKITVLIIDGFLIPKGLIKIDSQA